MRGPAPAPTMLNDKQHYCGSGSPHLQPREILVIAIHGSEVDVE